MKAYFKKMEKWLPSTEPSFAIDAIAMAVLMVFCLAGAIYVKTNPLGAADFSVSLFLTVSVFFALEAASVYYSGLRTLFGGMVKRLLLVIIGLPVFIKFYAGLKTKKASHWLKALGRYFWGGIIYQWKQRPEMLSGEDYCLGLVHLAKLARLASAKDLNLTDSEHYSLKEQYWEYYRSLKALGRERYLPEERKSLFILTEVNLVACLVGVTYMVERMSNVHQMYWETAENRIAWIIKQYGEKLLKDFARDLCWEYSKDYEKCLTEYKKANAFGRHYRHAVNFNRMVTRLEHFEGEEISIDLRPHDRGALAIMIGDECFDPE